MSRSQDVLGILKAFQLIAEAGIELQKRNSKVIWQNSSFRSLLEECIKGANLKKNPDLNLKKISESTYEGVDRLCAVAHGIKVYSTLDIGKFCMTNHLFKPVSPFLVNICGKCNHLSNLLVFLSTN